MRVRTIRVEVFRRFEDRTFDFDPGVTLVTGRNGAGKSTLLDAVALGLGAFVEALGIPAPGVTSEDDGEAGAASFELQAWSDGRDLRWTRSADPDEGDLEAVRAEARSLASAPPGGGVLPLLAYYHGGLSRPAAAAPPGDPRLAAYEGCLSLGDPEPAVVERLAALAAEASPGSRPALLVAVEAALTEVIGDSDPVALGAEEGALLVTVGDRPPAPFHRLGAAARRVAAIVADLVLRASTLNPHLGAAAARSTPGIALIEDLEARLHPRWQRYLLDDLRRLFPRVQIVATTTSPFLLQSLHAGDYVDLDGRAPAAVAQLSVEDITEVVLGVRMPQRSKRFHDMNAAAKEVMALVRAGAPIDPQEKAALQARLDAKMLPYSNDPAFHAVLTMERLAAGLAEPSSDDGEEDAP